MKLSCSLLSQKTYYVILSTVKLLACPNFVYVFDSQFLFNAAKKYVVEIATHRHGCCVLNQCIAHSTGKHREKLIAEVCFNALVLAQDSFG